MAEPDSGYDVAVVGDGIAGLTAALFSARHGRSTIVFGSLGGGELLNIEGVEDFPGFADPVAGFELCPALVGQALNEGAELRPAEVLGVDPVDGGLVVRTDRGDVGARAVIVASGATPRRLGVPGEERLAGKGVSQCASCDGPIFRDRVVGVVGGGDSALQEAIALTKHVGRVLLFHRGERFGAQATYVRRVLEHPSIEVRFSTVVEEIVGEETVSGVRVRDVSTGAEASHELSAVFVYVGLEPRTEFLSGLVELDESGSIPTDAWLRTAVAGVFAAGIVRTDAAGQAVSSAGDGATAAVAAHRYLLERDA